jgi:hypothetical protein
MLIHIGTSDLVSRRNSGADEAHVSTPAATQDLVWDLAIKGSGHFLAML